MTKLERQKRNPRSLYWRAKADAVWSKLIRQAGVCAVNNADCSGGLNAHHLIGRRVGCVRHSLQNGICLCATHHVFSSRLSPHQGAVGFAAWMQGNRPEQWTWAMEHRWDQARPDYKAAYERLKAIQEEL